MSEGLPPSERMAAAFTKLRTSATHIKAVSDELSRSVSAVERALNRLDLRVACWTLIHEDKGTDGDSYDREYVGYIEHEGDWRVVVNTESGHESRPGEPKSDKTWLFDLAPQYLRGKAIDKLPELIDALATTVDKTAERLKKRVGAAQEIATAIVVVKKKVTS